MKNFGELYNFIYSWQKEHDSDFQAIPIDNHAHLVFNCKSSIHTFIFSKMSKRNECIRDIPTELMTEFCSMYKNLTAEGIDETVYVYI